MKTKKAQAAIIGTIIFIIVAVAAFGAFAMTMGAQSDYNAVAVQRSQFLAVRGEESLYAFYNSTSGEIVVANTGSVISTVIGIITISNNYQMNEQPAHFVIAPTSTYSFAFSNFGSYQKVGLLTAYGNVFWVAPNPFNPQSGSF